MPELCPNCGESLPRNAKFCRECGSDAKTGWRSSEDIEYDSIELPEQGDYEEFLQREGLQTRGVQKGRRWIFLVALILILALFLSLLL